MNDNFQKVTDKYEDVYGLRAVLSALNDPTASERELALIAALCRYEAHVDKANVTESECENLVAWVRRKLDIKEDEDLRSAIIDIANSRHLQAKAVIGQVSLKRELDETRKHMRTVITNMVKSLEERDAEWCSRLRALSKEYLNALEKAQDLRERTESLALHGLTENK